MHSKHSLAVAALVAATFLTTSPQSQADVIITIPHVTVAPGGSGYLDVLISSDGTDSFQKYLLDFVVGGVGHAAAPINFVESAVPAPQLTATGPDYIFLSNSLEEYLQLGIDFVTDQAGGPTANDLITVADETFSTLDRTIALSDGDFLLARLNFVAPLSATPGNVYDISLDFGEFLDIDSNPATDILSSNVGSITIVAAAAAVPEPSSIALLALGSLVWFDRSRRCRNEGAALKSLEHK